MDRKFKDTYENNEPQWTKILQEEIINTLKCTQKCQSPEIGKIKFLKTFYTTIYPSHIT